MDWSGISAVASAVAAIASLGALYFAWQTISLMNTTLKEEREFKRPLLTVMHPAINVDGYKQGKGRVQFTAKNIGARPASDLVGEVMFLEEGSMAMHPLIEISSSNDVLPGDEIEVGGDVPLFGSDMHHHFLIIALKYNDLLMNKTSGQVHFLRWHGTVSQQSQIVAQASLREKQILSERFKEHLSKYQFTK